MLVKKPCRMNDMDITIALFSRGSETVMDADYRESQSYRNYHRTVTLKGQLVGARSFFRLDRRETGDSDPSSGSLVFRPSVLKKAGVVLNKGDRILKMNGVDVDFNIIKVSPLGPYHNHMLLTSVEFETQRKKKESI